LTPVVTSTLAPSFPSPWGGILTPACRAVAPDGFSLRPFIASSVFGISKRDDVLYGPPFKQWSSLFPARFFLSSSLPFFIDQPVSVFSHLYSFLRCHSRLYAALITHKQTSQTSLLPVAVFLVLPLFKHFDFSLLCLQTPYPRPLLHFSLQVPKLYSKTCAPPFSRAESQGRFSRRSLIRPPCVLLSSLRFIPPPCV